MRNLLIAGIIASSALSVSAAPKSDLSKKLESLNIPSDKVTPLVSEEKLYVVNKRYSSLTNRHELSFAGGNNFNADDHLSSTMVAAAYRYHVNSDWSVGARYSEYQNELSGSGKKLYDDRKLLPDSDYALKGSEVFVNYNTIYGKLRLTSDTIVYFDQYISLGYGTIALANGETQNYIADLGFSFWIGKHMSARVGAKNEFYQQQKMNGDSNVHAVQGYLEFGYLFGEGRI